LIIKNKSIALLALFFISTTTSDVRVLNEYVNLSTILFALFSLLHIKTILNAQNRLFDITYMMLIMIAVVSASINQSGDKTVSHLVAYSCSICFFGIFIGRIFSAYTIEQLKNAAIYALQTIALCVVFEVVINYYFDLPPFLPRVDDIIYDPPLIFFGIDLVRARGGMVESGHLALACIGIFAIIKALPDTPKKSFAATISIFLIVILSNSVAAMLSLIAIVIFDIKPRIRYLIVGFLSLMVVLYLFAPAVISKFSDQSYLDRINRIIIAYDVLEKKPQLLFFGVGPGNAPLWGIDGSIVSFLILLIFEYGFLSLLILIALFLFLSTKNKKNFDGLKLNMVLCLFILQALSISNFWYTSFWILPGLLYFISAKCTNKRIYLPPSVL
jgi:hypothetical protein